MIGGKKQGDLLLITGELIEVKSVPFADAKFIVGGAAKAPRYRVVVVVTEGAEADWFVLGEIALGPGNWRWGRPEGLANALTCWYAPTTTVGCLREWSCGHE